MTIDQQIYRAQEMAKDAIILSDLAELGERKMLANLRTSILPHKLIAKKLKISPQYLSDILRGRRAVTRQFMDKLIKAK